MPSRSELNERFKVYERQSRHIRIAGIGVLVTCLVIGTGAIIAKTSHTEALTLNPLKKVLFVLSASLVNSESGEFQVAAAGNADTWGKRIRNFLCTWVSDCAEQYATTLPALQRTSATQPRATTTPPAPPPRAAAPQPTTVINQPARTESVARVVERVIERVVERAVPEPLAAYVTRQEWQSQLSALQQQASANTRAVESNWNALALATRVDSLSGTTLSNPTITGGSITSSSITGTLTNVLDSISGAIASLTGTELTYTRASLTSATSTNLYATNLTAESAAVGSLTSTTTATSTFAGGVSLLRLSTSATSTLSGLAVDGSGLRLTTLDCSSLGNGGTLTTDASGNVVCADDDSGAGASSSFSTTSADYWKGQRDFFSTTSASHFLSQNRGAAFSTTSADTWILASSTIPKTTLAINWSALQTFDSGLISHASSTFTGFANFAAGASTTHLTTSGTTWLTSLTGVLLATDSSGKVVATTSIGANLLSGTLAVSQGGTGQTTLTGIVKGSGTSALTAITTSSGIAAELSDETGSGALVFATSPSLASPAFTGLSAFTQSSSTQQSILDALYVGRTATTTVRGDGQASTLPYASTTALTVSGTGYFGTATSTSLYGANLKDCQSNNVLTWNGGLFGCEADDTGAGGAWPFTPTAYDGVAMHATSTGLWLTATSPFSLIASSTFFTQASTTLFTNIGTTYLTALSSALLGVDNTGKVVASTTIGWNLLKGAASSLFAFDESGNPMATTSIGANFITGGLGTINSTSFARGDSITITAASSTLLGNNNTFSGNNIFTGSLTLGSLNGPLHANNGAVGATTSIGILYGGTGLTTAPSYGQVLVGNSSGGYTLTATSSLGLGSTSLSGTTGQVAYFSGTNSAVGTSSLFIASSGNVGIGTTNPFKALDVRSAASSDQATVVVGTTNTWGVGQGTGILFKDSAGQVGHIQVAYDGTYTNMNFGGLYSAGYGATTTQVMTLMGSGNVGIGTTSPAQLLSVAGNGYLTGGLGVGKVESTAGKISATSLAISGSSVVLSGLGSVNAPATTVLCVDADGITVRKGADFQACYAVDGDIAENYGTEETVVRGEIVALGTTVSSRDFTIHVPAPGESTSTPYTITTAKVRKATFDTRARLIGAVPTAPMMIGNDVIDPSENPMPVALVGHVPVRMALDGGDIEIGDPITVSISTAGFGMKATTTGRILGWALEPFSAAATSSDGMIEVYVKPQDWIAPDSIAGGLALLTLEDLASTTAEADDGSFAERFVSALFTRITAWLADAANGIRDLYASIVHSDRVETRELCVEDVCVTRDQFAEVFGSSQNAAAAGASTAGTRDEAGAPGGQSAPDGGIGADTATTIPSSDSEPITSAASSTSEIAPPANDNEPPVEEAPTVEAVPELELEAPADPVHFPEPANDNQLLPSAEAI